MTVDDPGVPDMTEDVAAVLKRYTEIQEEEHRLKEEKAELQEKLKAHMTPTGCKRWAVDVDGKALKVSLSSRTEVAYDEDVLASRLGDRYASILSPDLRKIRAALPRITPYLDPVMVQIGSPDPDKVRAAVDNGTVSTDEFAGAFSKQLKQTITVARDKR